MTDDEPKYTAEQWRIIQAEKRLEGHIRRSCTGNWIYTQQCYDNIMASIHSIIRPDAGIEIMVSPSDPPMEKKEKKKKKPKEVKEQE